MLVSRLLKKINRVWLEPITVMVWGILLLDYWVKGSLQVLIHPSYFGLVAVTGLSLLVIGSIKVYLLYKYPQAPQQNTGHVSLLPGNWAIWLLLVTAIAGLLITPKVFTSATAIQRGVTEMSSVTRSHPQSFRSQSKPEQRSLVDWVRTLNAYPEPDTYTDLKVNINGFVVPSPDLGNKYILLSRFIITCCAADVYPVALTIKLPAGQSYQPDVWLQVEGKMATETLGDKRQLIVVAQKIQPIATPQNPYEY
jgi:uncharacterized repeat protein (TIGR03943 family)